MTNVYVFGYSGHESQCYLVRADDKYQAKGKLTDELGYDPLADCLGTVEEAADSDVTRVA